MYLSDRVLGHVRSAIEEPDLGETKYEIVRELGRGGMGTVWAVLDKELGREVALKVASGDRLHHEARVLARLEHPGIVPVHDMGTLPDGRTFYVMKLVRGDRLDRFLEKKPEPSTALRLFQRICDAVAFAHAHGVLHRDLKPQNVMIGAFGEALVMDWGLAREVTDEEAPGTIAGTRAFMSPEQSRGEEIDVRSDVYALGAILRAMVAEPANPLASIIAKATAESAKDRYASVELFSADIERFLDGRSPLAHRESWMETIARFVSRHRVILSLLLVYLIVRVLIAALAR